MPTFTGTSNNDILDGTADRDTLEGLGGDDILSGGDGDDTIDGGDGDDALNGGTGDDIIIGGAGNGRFDGGDGFDRLDYSASPGPVTVSLLTGTVLDNGFGGTNYFSNIESVTGSAFNDWLFGDQGANVLDGGAGTDLMNGNSGSDTYLVDNIYDRIEENDFPDDIDTVRSSANFNLGTHAGQVENLELVGSAPTKGIGNDKANVITGNASANVLDGSGGADTLYGGDGNDIYYVDDVGDRVIEASAAGGLDIVRSRYYSYVLGDHVENLTLISSAILGTGNALANVITGNVYANVLDGGAGADSLRGGRGNDTYEVDDPGDRVIETSATGGIDTVRSQVTFILGGNVEHLVLTGAAAINGTGNALVNQITGNAAANVLNGGAGADTMKGNGGDDIYQVDNVGDKAIETAATDGVDLVKSAVSFTLGNYVENLTLLGRAEIDGSGNALANVINGNGGANRLSGLTGNDELHGGAGSDRLYGGVGHDILDGGAGSDSFYFDTVLSAANNVDRLSGFRAAQDTIYLDDAIFRELAPGTLPASAFCTGSVALDADDRILYDAATGHIVYYAGPGVAFPVLFATVDPGTILTAADFIVY